MTAKCTRLIDFRPTGVFPLFSHAGLKPTGRCNTLLRKVFRCQDEKFQHEKRDDLRKSTFLARIE
jgi:hypothetical protein